MGILQNLLQRMKHANSKNYQRLASAAAQKGRTLGVDEDE